MIIKKPFSLKDERIDKANKMMNELAFLKMGKSKPPQPSLPQDCFLDPPPVQEMLKEFSTANLIEKENEKLQGKKIEIVKHDETR